MPVRRGFCDFKGQLILKKDAEIAPLKEGRRFFSAGKMKSLFSKLLPCALALWMAKNGLDFMNPLAEVAHMHPPAFEKLSFVPIVHKCSFVLSTELTWELSVSCTILYFLVVDWLLRRPFTHISSKGVGSVNHL